MIDPNTIAAFVPGGAGSVMLDWESASEWSPDVWIELSPLLEHILSPGLQEWLRHGARSPPPSGLLDAAQLVTQQHLDPPSQAAIVDRFLSELFDVSVVEFLRELDLRPQVLQEFFNELATVGQYDDTLARLQDWVESSFDPWDTLHDWERIVLGSMVILAVILGLIFGLSNMAAVGTLNAGLAAAIVMAWLVGQMMGWVFVIGAAVILLVGLIAWLFGRNDKEAEPQGADNESSDLNGPIVPPWWESEIPWLRTAEGRSLRELLALASASCLSTDVRSLLYMRLRAFSR